MLILAPMQGLTELMFRKAYHHCYPGAFDLSVSPFLSLTHGNLADAWKKIDDVIPKDNEDSIPVIPQILGKEPIEFVGLANRLYDLGHTEINWNIGCPMRRVTAKHRGSGILPHPNEIRSILDYVVPRLKPQLSVKMRLGLKSPQEIFAVIPVLNDYPLANVTVHPRTGHQQYGGTVDLDTLQQAIPLFRHHLIYNGDICTIEDFRRIRHRFPQINDFMIGRGVLYAPHLPLLIRQELSGAPTDSQPTTAAAFVNTLLDAIDQLPIAPLTKMRKIKEYWCLVRRSLPITEQQAYAVLHAQDYDSARSQVKRFLTPQQPTDI